MYYWFFFATNCSLVLLGNNFLYMSNGMIFPSLPISTLYGNITLLGPADVFRFAVNMDHFILKWIKCIFTVVLGTILGCLLLHLIHGSCSSASAHHSEVDNFSAICASLPIGLALSLGMATSTVSTSLPCGHFCLHF